MPLPEHTGNVPLSGAARALSFGEQRVRMTFNPNGDDNVTMMKALAAHFIDACDAILEKTDDGEARRCLELAMTNCETAAMYAVKGVTTRR